MNPATNLPLDSSEPVTWRFWMVQALANRKGATHCVPSVKRQLTRSVWPSPSNVPV